jgi:hypothetical protein
VALGIFLNVKQLRATRGALMHTGVIAEQRSHLFTRYTLLQASMESSAASSSSLVIAPVAVHGSTAGTVADGDSVLLVFSDGLQMFADVHQGR